MLIALLYPNHSTMKKRYKLKEKLDYKTTYHLTDIVKKEWYEFMVKNLSSLTPQQKDFVVRLQHRECITANELHFVKSFIPFTPFLYKGVEFSKGKKGTGNKWVKLDGKKVNGNPQRFPSTLPQHQYR